MGDLVEGVRVASNGDYFIPRPNPELEATLDEKFLRMPGKLRWYPFAKDEKHLVDDNIFRDKVCYIIGKGPSLDNVTFCHFKEGCPIVCINQSIHTIERLGVKNPLYCIQQDKGLQALCKPKSARLWVSYEARAFYRDYDNKAVFMVEEHGSHGMYTATLAIKMIQRFGGVKLIMIGFDACIDGQITYAKSIEKPLVGDGNRFIKACIQFKQHAKIPLHFMGIK